MKKLDRKHNLSEERIKELTEKQKKMIEEKIAARRKKKIQHKK